MEFENFLKHGSSLVLVIVDFTCRQPLHYEPGSRVVLIEGKRITLCGIFGGAPGN